MTTFSDIVEILDEAVGGSATPVGFHGAFWRNVTRCEFINTPAYDGVIPVVVNDSHASGIISALRGTGVFSETIVQMPPFLPPVSEEKIQIIANWIDAGCPE